MSRDAAIEAGARAWHAAECCTDWPSAYCDGPSSRDREQMADAIDALLPHLPRPERVVKAEALREAARWLLSLTSPNSDEDKRTAHWLDRRGARIERGDA